MINKKKFKNRKKKRDERHEVPHFYLEKNLFKNYITANGDYNVV